MATRRRKKQTKGSEDYRHPESTSPMRPDVGTQAQFRKKKPPVTYRYDSSLSPALDWDGQNGARELGEWLLACIEDAAALEPPHKFSEPRVFKGGDGAVLVTVSGLHDAVEQLKRLGKPFLNWAGKAERLSFDVPTLPLFVHERLSTQAIIETLKSHRKAPALNQMALFADPQHSVSDQVLRAYEYRDNWVNRLILGDSLVVMNSLLHYEGLGGQVQMIYMDPPYGVRFGSNFQPFVRRTEVRHNDDDDVTREPEMVQAYRDTWELGIHSYLTYMRDRLLVSRELLGPSGSVFVQISDENLHHLRELMDEVFGADNLVAVIAFTKTTVATSLLLPTVCDFVLWYAKDRSAVKFRSLFLPKKLGDEGATRYNFLELPDGTRRRLTKEEQEGSVAAPASGRLYTTTDLKSQGFRQFTTVPFAFQGQEYHPGPNMNWKTTLQGLERLAGQSRIVVEGNSLRYLRYFDDYPVNPLSNVWTDIGGIQSRTDPKVYVVQTTNKAIMRCMLMTTDPGDLVLDPTCGSGTTAYVAEQWGRRWISIDVSRVPAALARQRILTATFPWYELQDEKRGPAGGFVYKRKQNKKGEEVGGIVPHITLKCIANNEEPQMEVLVDRPEEDKAITRVAGPFVVEATIPTPVDWEADGEEDSGADMQERGAFLDRMLEVLRKSPVLRLEGNRTVTLKNVRPPAKSLSLSAEAMVTPAELGPPKTLEDMREHALDAKGGRLPFSDRPVAILFGPENGAVSEKLVYEAAREAHAKDYAHMFVIGFAVQPNARKLVDDCDKAVGVPASYVQMTPDLMMGDLLKNMRSSQIFSVCGLPEIAVRKTKGGKYQVELLGLDTFDPATMKPEHRRGDDVPAWFLDTDYNGLCFHVCHAFFPLTGAWESIKKALKGTYDESVWDHLAGTTSAEFEPGEHGQVAVKVIDDRGNELLVVKDLKEAD
ncbi:MAG: site-specific DNA-methyltransferase [Candidatus Brocadiaceae bacterium]|nr:site-specific DNA-methyltransferase [Candidatus Brocadiaceae bacterium]